jgi:hypothetical protein
MRIAVFFLSMSAFAQTAIAPPSAGYVVDFEGRLRPVYGVAGNFTVGEVLGVAPTRDMPAGVLRSARGVQIVRADGAVVDALPSATGPVLLQGEVRVYATQDEVVIRHADASELRLALAGVALLHSMSTDYVQVNAAARIYALRVTAGHEELFLLPVTAAGKEHRR